MELSEGTLQVLKNFATINSNIVIKQGNALKTISEAKNLLASASILEDIPIDFGIYDLNQFLNVLSLVDTPRLTFKDDYVIIGDSTGRTEIKYFYSDMDMLTSPSKDIVMPSTEVKFVLDNETLNKIKRAASALEHTAVAISSNSGVIRLSVIDPENATSNTFSIDVDGEFPADATFNFILSTNNLKILPGDYEVEISSKLITQFSHKSLDVKYWIALEKSSTFGV